MFPTRLKNAAIMTLFKEGDNNNIPNYRLISLLTTFSKVFEKIIYVRLYSYSYSYSLFVQPPGHTCNIGFVQYNKE